MSTYREKVTRVKKWSLDHEDVLIFGGLTLFVVGFVYAGVKAEMAYTERQTTELNYYIDQLNDAHKQALEQVNEALTLLEKTA